LPESACKTLGAPPLPWTFAAAASRAAQNDLGRLDGLGDEVRAPCVADADVRLREGRALEGVRARRERVGIAVAAGVRELLLLILAGALLEAVRLREGVPPGVPVTGGLSVIVPLGVRERVAPGLLVLVAVRRAEAVVVAVAVRVPAPVPVPVAVPVVVPVRVDVRVPLPVDAAVPLPVGVDVLVRVEEPVPVPVRVPVRVPEAVAVELRVEEPVGVEVRDETAVALGSVTVSMRTKLAAEAELAAVQPTNAGQGSPSQRSAPQTSTDMLYGPCQVTPLVRSVPVAMTRREMTPAPVSTTASTVTTRDHQLPPAAMNEAGEISPPAPRDAPARSAPNVVSSCVPVRQSRRTPTAGVMPQKPRHAGSSVAAVPRCWPSAAAPRESRCSTNARPSHQALDAAARDVIEKDQ